MRQHLRQRNREFPAILQMARNRHLATDRRLRRNDSGDREIDGSSAAEMQRMAHGQDYSAGRTVKVNRRSNSPSAAPLRFTPIVSCLTVPTTAR